MLIRMNFSKLPFSQVCFKLRILALCSLLFNPAASQEIEKASFPRCEGSILGDEVLIPKTLLASQDVVSNHLETTSIRLTQSQFSCDEGEGKPYYLHVPVHNLQDLASQTLTLFQDGYILHDKFYYSQDEYCIQSIKPEGNNYTLTVKICEPQSKCSSGNNVCVQKCCQPTKVWDLKNYSKGNGALSCKDSGEKAWKPELYSDVHSRLNDAQANKMNIRFMEAHPKTFCDGGFFLMTLKDYDGLEASPFRVLKSGKVVMKIGRNSWEDVPSRMYCVDGAMNFNTENDTEHFNQTFKVDEYSGEPSDTVMLVCTGFLEDPDVDFDGSPNLLYVIAMLVSSVFLLLTVIVYVIIWRHQHIHGWTFLGYVLSLLLTFVFLSTAHLVNGGETDCALVGIACHFFFLSTFTWLSTLNFDIYWTFRSLNSNPGRKSEIIRFLCYSVFAIGVPVIIVSVGLILDSIYGDDPESEVIVPRYGVTRCTMDRSADFPYLFGPISFLLGCNLILFPTTLYHIYQSQKITKLSGMKSSMLKHKIRFFGKLFILAGITWIFEVISWACTEPGKPIHWIWKLLDLVNILQAIAIFVVFVCNRKTFGELLEKFPCFKRISTIIEKATGVNVSNTGRKESHTPISSVFDLPGLDVVELEGK